MAYASGSGSGVPIRRSSETLPVEHSSSRTDADVPVAPRVLWLTLQLSFNQRFLYHPTLDTEDAPCVCSLLSLIFSAGASYAAHITCVSHHGIGMCCSPRT